jgi:DNA-binding FrmR family transcriptional regulator
VKALTAKRQEVDEEKARVLNRLRRLEGQVRGLQKMIDEERPCPEILTLLAGIRSALDATGDLILEKYLLDCQANPGGMADPQAIIQTVRLARR